MRKIAMTILGLIVVSSSVGCGSEAGLDGQHPSATQFDESGASEVQATEHTDETQVELAEKVELITSFEVGGTQYTFLDVDGSIGVRMLGRIGVTPPSVQAQDGSGPLTTLEIYQALQPDAVPDERLVAAHIAEAKALGRPDDSIRATEIATVIEKAQGQLGAWSDCETTISAATGIWGLVGTDWNYNSSRTGSLNTTVTGPTTNKLSKAAGLCNGYGSPSLNGWRCGVDKKTGTGAWTRVYTSPNVNVGWFDIFSFGTSTSNTSIRVKTTTKPAGTSQVDLAALVDLLP